jgi:hypothetical protein
MPERIGVKRARSPQVGDFSLADQRLLRAAFHGFIPTVLVGGPAAHPHVISVGHPDGIADAKTIPKNSRYYSMARIKGVGAQEEAPARSRSSGR